MGKVLKARPPTPLEERLKLSEERFHHLAALSSDWYWEQDEQFRLTFMSSAMTEKTGLDASAYLGHRRWDRPALNLSEADWARHRAQLERHEPFRDFEMQRDAGDGRTVWLSVSGEPVFDGHGAFTGYRGVGRDITAQKAAAAALRASEARFRSLMDASPDMVYVTDRETMRFVYANETACRLTGYSREEFMKLGPADVLRADRAQVERNFDEAIAAGAEGTVQELKSITKDGLRTMVEVRRRALQIDGRWIVFTISNDISARKRAEQALIRSGRMFAALSTTNEAILRSSSPDELYLRVCQAAVEGGKLLTTVALLPDAGVARVVAASGVVPQALRELAVPLDRDTPEARGLVGTAFRTGASQVSNDLLRDEAARPWHAPAREHGIAAAAAIPLVKEGNVLGVLLFFSDEKHTFDAEIVKLLERMAENVVFALDNFAGEQQRRIAEDRIQYLATHDALTGLPNRMMFSQLLNHAIGGAQRYKRAFALLFIDLDRFKTINDSLGHQAGDQVLQAVATRLKKTVRGSDVVARLSGDEFVVLVQETAEASQAEAVAHKVLAALAVPIRLGGRECSLTASIGISICPRDGADERTLLKHADDAMYRAKDEGRNGFRLHQPDGSAPT